MPPQASNRISRAAISTSDTCTSSRSCRPTRRNSGSPFGRRSVRVRHAQPPAPRHVPLQPRAQLLRRVAAKRTLKRFLSTNDRVIELSESFNKQGYYKGTESGDRCRQRNEVQRVSRENYARDDDITERVFPKSHPWFCARHLFIQKGRYRAMQPTIVQQ